MSDPPKALPLNPTKLPWPARTIAEAMPEFTEKRPNGRKQKGDRDVVGRKRK